MLGKGRGRDISFSVHGVRAWNEPPQQVMARSARWKFIWYPHAEERDRLVLYDMEKDPEEITNVAARPENKAVVAEHRKAVEGFLAGLKKPEYAPKGLEKQRKHTPEGEEGGRFRRKG